MKDGDGKWIGYGLGDTLPLVSKIQRRLIYAYPKYSKALTHGVTESGTFDEPTRQAVIDITMHINMTQKKNLRTDGVADWRVLVALGVVVPAPAAPTKRFVQQGVGFNTSAFLMGDPTHSYMDALAAGSTELLRLALPDDRPKVIIGYSMGDDVANRAMLRWPADRRDEIKAVIGFGGPSRPPGVTLLGNDPGGKGISGVFTPDWLLDRTWQFTHEGDMYANAVGILPQLYQILVRLEASIEFAGYLFNVFATSFGQQLLGLIGSTVPGAGALKPLLGLITPGPPNKTDGDIDLLSTAPPRSSATTCAKPWCTRCPAPFRFGTMARRRGRHGNSRNRIEVQACGLTDSSGLTVCGGRFVPFARHSGRSLQPSSVVYSPPLV